MLKGMLSIIPGRASTPPNGFPAICVLITFPSMYLGQYQHFFINADVKTPTFLNSTRPFNTQKPLSKITQCPVVWMGRVRHNNKPTVFLPRFLYGQPRSKFRGLHQLQLIQDMSLTATDCVVLIPHQMRLLWHINPSRTCPL